MDKIVYIIDKYLFTEYEDNLAAAIKRSGMQVVFYDDICGLTFKEFVIKRFTEKDIVVFHGSLQHGRQLTHLPIYPGVFMTIDNYECYKYYGYYGNHLLNSEYMMMGLNDVVRNRERILKIIPSFGFADRGRDIKAFIRPSNGYKSFTGQLISLNNIEAEIELLKNTYGGIDPDTLVLVSKPQDIKEEYRFIIIDGEVISGAMYLDEFNAGKYTPYYDKPCQDEMAYAFAESLVGLYTPDKAFTMDICKTAAGDYKLLEINSFNCASMYGNDYDKVVEAVNKLAINEYNDLFLI